MQVLDLISRVRKEIGDPLVPFRSIDMSDGIVTEYNLPVVNVEPVGFLAEIINEGSATGLNTTQYTMDYAEGKLSLSAPAPYGANVVAAGSAYDMMSNDDLSVHLRDAINWHCYNRRNVERYRDRHGFITYRDASVNLGNLPSIEEPLVVIRSTSNIFWSLANDAATDVNISTGEGTTIDRSARYHQLMGQIAALEERYARDSLVLNVGPYRIEVGDLRRVSQTSGRLVPLFKSREYDSHAYPVRKIPPIDSQYEDNSGVPGMLWYGGGGL